MWQWCSSVWTASWINETARARLFSAPWGTTTAELWSQGKLFGNAVDSKPLLSQFKWFKVKFWVCVVYSNLIWSKEVVTSTQIPIFLEGIWFHLSSLLLYRFSLMRLHCFCLLPSSRQTEQPPEQLWSITAQVWLSWQAELYEPLFS